MTDLENKFNKSVDKVNKFFFTSEASSLEKKPSNEVLLKLYGLYKQATLGNINTPKPSGLFNYKLSEKWKSWNECKDLETEKAQQKYIDIVNSFI